MGFSFDMFRMAKSEDFEGFWEAPGERFRISIFL